MRLADRDRQRPSNALLLIAATLVSLTAVLVLPVGSPIRVVAGLILFIVLPGLGVQFVLLPPRSPMPAWERLALIGALGIASSGLASVLLVVAGWPLTETSVGATCALIAVVGAIASLVERGSPAIRKRWGGTLRLALTLVLIVSGGLIASVFASSESTDHFTILALEDPLDAQATAQTLTAQGGRATVTVIVESHEADIAEYRLSVEGGARSPTFTLQPLERRVMEVEIVDTPDGSTEIQLLRSGLVDRSLRLTTH